MRHRTAALFLAVTAIAFSQGPPPPGGGGMQQGDGIWLRDARWGEAETFDACLGHQPNNGQYHHHVQPVCLRAQLGDNLEQVLSSRTGVRYREKTGGWTHSPILGWAFDGHPVYGPYGYSDPRNPSSAVKRVKPSFRLRDITVRQTLPDWALPIHSGASRQLNPNQYGPPVNDSFPLGRYNEDYEFVAGLGDLDQYNGRFAITPEFPEGTYAYYITVDDDGQPAFPYVIGLQYNSAATGGQIRGQVPAGLQDYAGDGAGRPHLASWLTNRSGETATVVSGFDPSAGAKNTWPVDAPAGVTVSGGVSTPALADAQRVRYSDTSVVITSNNLPSYTIGPWFAAFSTSGVFNNWPSRQDFTVQIPRSATTPANRTATPLGAVGVWVNGVAMFNTLDGASYSNARGADVGGGIVNLTASQASAASGERGPVAPGSPMTATPNFGLRFTVEPSEAPSSDWPLSLGGATVTIRDSAGVSHPAPIGSAAPRQVTYRVPESVSPGVATVTISAGGTQFTSGLTILTVYPSLYQVNPDGLMLGRVSTAGETKGVSETPVELGGDPVVLTVIATGHANAESLAMTIGGVPVEIVSRGGAGPGAEELTAEVPKGLAGRGRVDVVLSASGKPSNPVYLTVR